MLLADDGQLAIRVSPEGAVQMSDAPTQDGGGGSPPADPVARTLVSLWQNNLVSLRAERFINWKSGGAVAYVSSADYSDAAAGSPV